MNITSFTPTSGPADTVVTLSLTDMPPDASTDNTVVILSGSPMVTVETVTVGADGSGTIEVTIEMNAQSGDFGVLVSSQQGYATAQSASIFTVDLPANQPQITNMTPRTAVAGQTQIMLSGVNLDEIQYVRVGNTAVMTIQHATPSTMIRFMVPSTAQSGQQRVYGQSQEYGRVNSPYMLTVQ
ncbi:IPT/TIG domain-containing protein [Jatrophihabitans sp.]|uniref:IPT/TIG domain-containing protein n=1 Tax=Jatrophihabitans sp. TaxID=1932789 RepID=UPI002F181679